MSAAGSERAGGADRNAARAAGARLRRGLAALAPFALAGAAAGWFACLWGPAHLFGEAPGRVPALAPAAGALAAIALGPLLTAATARFGRAAVVLGYLASSALALPVLFFRGMQLATAPRPGDVEVPALLGQIATLLLYCPPPLAPVAWAAARTRRARPGSLLDFAERRRVWARTAFVAAALALAGGLSHPGPGVRRDAIAAVAVAAIALAALALADTRAVARVTALFASVRRQTAADAGGEPAPFDLGRGDERWALAEPCAGRHALLGSPFAVQPALLAFAAVDALGLAAALGAGACLLASPVPPAPPAPPVAAPAAAPPAAAEPPPQPALFWYAQSAVKPPLLADLNGDGVDEIVGLRWDPNRNDRPLSLVATDGATLRTLWRTEPVRSVWGSERARVVRGGGLAFVRDSEGLLSIYDLKSGRAACAPIEVGVEGSTLLAAPEGPARVWVQTGRSWAERDEGLLVTGACEVSKAGAPAWGPGLEVVSLCGAKAGGPVCVRRRPVSTARLRLEPATSYEEGDVGLTEGYARGAGARPYLAGFDPRTGATRWEAPLAYDDDDAHPAPRHRVLLGGGRAFGLYALPDGRWKLGARAGATGEALWSREVPRLARGAQPWSMTEARGRLYVVFGNRLEIFDAATGASLGVLD